MRGILEKHDVEGVLLVDATNAFNSLNRKVTPHNIKYVCPSLENVLTNCYQSQIHLFRPSNGEFTSQEGTTQGDPLGMAMFTLAMVPLINKPAEVCKSVYQIWFADNATAASTASVQHLSPVANPPTQIDGLWGREWCILMATGLTHRGTQLNSPWARVRVRVRVRDALCLRYGWNIINVSSRCACGATFDVDHAMSCHKGGRLPYATMRYET